MNYTEYAKYCRLVEKIEKEIARLLARGEIVARFKGRMEFGARALGNRSILADPSRREVIKTINEMIKKRDFWMPFAPSMLPERESEYLINPKNIESLYMIMSFDAMDNTEHLFAALKEGTVLSGAMFTICNSP